MKGLKHQSSLEKKQNTGAAKKVKEEQRDFGEKQLEETELWSAYDVPDRSSVQITVINEVIICFLVPLVFLILNIARRCQDSPNLFSPFQLDPMHKGVGTIIDTTNILLLTGVYVCSLGGLVLGMRGMEVREGSGEQGYFQVLIVHTAEAIYPYNTIIGFAAHDCLRFKWFQDGEILRHGEKHHRDNGSPWRFRSGDLVGLMVDCTELPTLRFSLHGVQKHQLVVAQEEYGIVLFPAFNLGIAQIQIASNPDLPIF